MDKNKEFIEAGDQLVKILFINGYSESTEKIYPSHWDAIQIHGYNPNGHKRYFTSPNEDYTIVLDYINVEIYRKGSGLFSFTKLEKQKAEYLIEALTFKNLEELTDFMLENIKK